MSVSSEFKSVVEQGDLIAARSYLTNYLIGEDDYSLFDEALAYASERLPVIQEDDGSDIEENKSLWTKDYLNGLLVKVVSNFSEKRINHIKEVASTVLQRHSDATSTLSSASHGSTSPKTGRTVIAETELHGAEKSATPKQPATSQRTSGKTGRQVVSETATPSGDSSQGKSTFRNTSKRTEDIVGTTLMIGGAAVAVVGIAVTEPLVIGAGALIAGTGAVITVNNKRK